MNYNNRLQTFGLLEPTCTANKEDLNITNDKKVNKFLIKFSSKSLLTVDLNIYLAEFYNTKIFQVETYLDENMNM